jgi:hypothetical protein
MKPPPLPHWSTWRGSGRCAQEELLVGQHIFVSDSNASDAWVSRRCGVLGLGYLDGVHGLLLMASAVYRLLPAPMSTWRG